MINIRSFQRDITEITSNLVELSNRLLVNDGIKNLAKQELNLANLSHFVATFIFFTEKKETPVLKKIIKQIGIKNEVDFNDLFLGKIKGSIAFKNGVQCSMNFFHCVHFPLVSNLDLHNIVKVIVYDKKYIAEFENWKLAAEFLGEDPSILIFVELNKGEEEDRFVPKVKGIKSVYYDANTVEGSIFSCLWQEDFYQYVQLAFLSRYSRQSRQVKTLLSESFETQYQYFQGQAILQTKDGEQAKKSLDEFSSIDLSLFKSKISEASKRIAKVIQERLTAFESEDEAYQSLKKEVTSFLGFVETKQSNSMTLRISEGAVKDKIGKVQEIITPFFKDSIKTIKDHYADLGKVFQRMFDEKDIGFLSLPQFNFSKKELEETTSSIAPIPGKTYEQNTSFKGIGTLLMELRKPLYMLMPLMMVFALFSALTNAEDKGSIDESVLFYNNKPCVAIDQLPESRSGKFLQFVRDVEKLRGADKAVFNYEINGEMKTVPQLAVKEITVKQPAGGKSEVVQTVDYDFDKKNNILYLYLNENADRTFVMNRLFDPKNRLLQSEGSSSRRGYGIAGIVRALSALKEYRVLLIVGISILIIWFITTRKKSMDTEFRSSKEKDQQKLNGDLLQHIDKSVRQSIQKFQTTAVTKIREHQSEFLEAIEVSSYEKIRDEKSRREEYFKAMQQKVTNLRTERMEFSRKKKILTKLTSKLQTLQSKIDRLK